MLFLTICADQRNEGYKGRGVPIYQNKTISMNSLQDYLTKFKAQGSQKLEKKVSSERAEIIQQFLTELNKDRGKYKPLTPGFVSMRMSKQIFPTNHHLYLFLAQCREAKNFSKYWWWALKAK